jgi:hypothetical protein
MGAIIALAAQDALRQCGKNLTITLAPQAYLLPLIGAARTVPHDMHGSAIVADFGHTSAKSAVAHFDEEGTLESLRPYPPLDLAPFTSEDRTAELAALMKQLLVARYKDATQQGAVAPCVVCSLAAYLDEWRQPVKLDRGAYTRLHLLAQPLDVSVWLAKGISAEVGREVTVSFARDTEAAAIAYAGMRPAHSTAVVMLGTAMGVGFVPSGDKFRPLADKLTIPK